jgi:hypothetical protein
MNTIILYFGIIALIILITYGFVQVIRKLNKILNLFNISLGEDDILVFTINRDLPMAAYERLRKTIKDKLEKSGYKNEVMIIDGDVKISKISKAQIEKTQN